MAQIEKRTDLDRGWTIYTLEVGQTRVDVVPEAGFNVRSFEHAGRAVLLEPPTLADLRGTKFGVPILYPSPNRVRDAHFTFQNRRYGFTPNKEKNFIHGLVHSIPWHVVEVREWIDRQSPTGEALEIEAAVDFAPGSPHYELFPHPHTLRVAISVRDGSVRWSYTIDNQIGTTRVPYGFGLHPYFRYQGSRETTFLRVGAAHWMEAIDLLPTGRLVPIGQTSLDMRSPRSLAGFHIDDVFTSLDPTEASATIEHRSAGFGIDLIATGDFTHVVVFTPANKEAFCVENQTCSTDAHNLAAIELQEAAHLLVVEPGQTLSGSVEYRIRPISY
jgi:aldose 1-epimerase